MPSYCTGSKWSWSLVIMRLTNESRTFLVPLAPSLVPPWIQLCWWPQLTLSALPCGPFLILCSSCGPSRAIGSQNLPRVAPLCTAPHSALLVLEHSTDGIKLLQRSTQSGLCWVSILCPTCGEATSLHWDVTTQGSGTVSTWAVLIKLLVTQWWTNSSKCKN